MIEIIIFLFIVIVTLLLVALLIMWLILPFFVIAINDKLQVLIDDNKK